MTPQGVEHQSSPLLSDPPVVTVDPNVRVQEAPGIEDLPSVVVEDMQTIDKPEFAAWGEGQPLPAGSYQVAVVYKGQDNVLIQTDRPRHLEEIADLAQAAWDNGDTVELGTEWEEACRMVVRPIPDVPPVEDSNADPMPKLPPYDVVTGKREMTDDERKDYFG